MRRFPLRRSRWTPFLLGPFGAARPSVEIHDEVLRLRMGAMGGGRVPLGLVTGVGTMRWPWWGGVGVRIARGLTAFIGASGTAAVVELSEPVSVRSPLPWKTRRIAVGVDDVDGFIQAVADSREGAVHHLGDAG